MKELPMLDEHAMIDAVSPPCLILAHPDGVYEAVVARSFRRLGWDLYLARSGPEVRRLVRMLEADVVIMDADLPEESGWLTCYKVMREQPLVKVILVSDNLSPRNQELATFVGASALVCHADGLTPLIEELTAQAVPAAG
jgi:two-component system, OmpR family, alkaline phosphatase synthesis response regulator PhoP